MITKSQLQDGFKFTYGTSIYKFSSTIPESEFYYVESLNNDKRNEYIGNIDSMDDESFTFYTFIMDIHKVEIKIYYKDCELVVE